MSANEKQKGLAAADHSDDAEGHDEEDTSEDKDGITHKAGRLSKEEVLKAEEFGKRVMAKVTAIGKEFGKHQGLILIEAGLATKATCKESTWNLHQAWFPTVYKDLEAAQAEGKGLSFLLPPAIVPNAPLLHNSKSARDRNRMVAPIIISEAFADAGQPSKTLNSRWMRMFDILYST
ncbi:uncharacterized protein F5147DRAFT_782263 [Suillus discolor]|uniref:Uncharacterized protein n=1 Tax=Suillus discolor TaxID=1912936 RepID=A0A9P7ERQ6_9AGAM|nr:uncharacterized protein F5147DRAFT_782263 [Suillus discolor]KAG2085008.1 hypothetical protein F5147DRAFT_782263 [Suillus discolor]